MIIRAFTAGVASAVASPARQRTSLAILNQSTTAILYIAFDQPAVAAPTAGQVTIGPLGATGQDPGNAGLSWRGPPDSVPWQSINIIASAAAAPVTILE